MSKRVVRLPLEAIFLVLFGAGLIPKLTWEGLEVSWGPETISLLRNYSPDAIGYFCYLLGVRFKPVLLCLALSITSAGKVVLLFFAGAWGFGCGLFVRNVFEIYGSQTLLFLAVSWLPQGLFYGFGYMGLLRYGETLHERFVSGRKAPGKVHKIQLFRRTLQIPDYTLWVQPVRVLMLLLAGCVLEAFAGAGCLKMLSQLIG